MARRPLAALVAFLLLPPVSLSAEEFKMPAVKFTKSASTPTVDRQAGVNAIKAHTMSLKKTFGDNIPEEKKEDLRERLAGLEGCKDMEFTPKEHPDCETSWTCTGAMYKKMTAGGSSTNRVANVGMIKHNRAMLLSDPMLFASANSFYTKLKHEVDLGSGSPSVDGPSGASISRKSAKNLYSMAQDLIQEGLGRKDAYLAMKTLILFGHDNRHNTLDGASRTKACHVKIIDALKPTENSNLYLNGAIGREYWEDEISAATAINEACVTATKNLVVERKMCTEYSDEPGRGWSGYQADYYHVIMSAYLHCNCLARGKSIIDDLTQGLQDGAYLFMVAKYKIDRFTEEINKGLANAGHTPAVRLLEYAFLKGDKGNKFGLNGIKITCDKAKASACLKAANVDAWEWPAWCSEIGSACQPKDIEVAKIMAKRYVFEVNFRVSQHFQGILFANANCKGTKIDRSACE